MYYIDIDWNEILIYENKNLIHKESSMILRDLKTEQLLFVANSAKEHLTDDKNLLAIIPIENKKILSYSNLNILLEYILKKFKLKDVLFVDRYKLNKNKINMGFINEIDFIKLISKKNNYIELRNNETQIFNLKNNKTEIINIGKYKLLNYLNRFFYLNFNGLLNTQKTLELFDKLKNKEVPIVNLKQVNIGKEFVIKDYSKDLLLKQITSFYNDIIKNQNISYFDCNENMKELMQIYEIMIKE